MAPLKQKGDLAELGDGMDTLTLRLVPARNGQLRRIRMAEDYADLPAAYPARTRGRGANGNTWPLQG